MPELTARRKTDRQAMALQVIDLADEYRFAAWYKPEQPGTRRATVDLEFPRGLKLTVKFDASPGGTDPDTYVLNWHGVVEGTRLDPCWFGSVNPYHGHKATDVARGFEALQDLLRQRFASVRDDYAFITSGGSDALDS